MIRKLLAILVLSVSVLRVNAQNELKARIEFEAAEALFSEGKYTEALERITETEQLLSKWQPNVSYLKIMTLNEIVDYENYTKRQTQELAREIGRYMKFANDNQETVVMEKFNSVYKLEKEIPHIIQYATFGEWPDYEVARKAYDAKDYAQALKLYEALGEKGNLRALDIIGGMYRDAEGVDKNYQKMLSYYQKAADAGFLISMTSLGDTYQKGWGVPVNKQEAFKWYLKAAKKGNLYAMCKVGSYYAGGIGVSKNNTEALKWLAKPSEKRYSAATLLIGGIYIEQAEETGKGWDQAFDFLIKAGKYGDKSADRYRTLAFMYEEGKGVAKDLTTALNFYKIAANKGDVVSQLQVGSFYLQGTGTSKDFGQALAWFLKAAAQQDERAQYLVGLMYQNGRGTPINNVQAMEWYIKAANQGNKEAMKQLAYMYENGLGVKRDKKLAREWEMKASQ